jgi:two-component system response regulator MtrA
MTARILLIEDDDELGAQVVHSLQSAGLKPTWIRDGDQARSAEVEQFALIILDLMLPGTYGLDLLKGFRERSDVPVLILSARNETDDKVRGLKLGADDYVTKPFWPEELLARVKARLRRPAMKRGDVLAFGRVIVDRSSHTARVDGQAVELTRAEFELLSELVRRAGAAVTRRALAEAALDPDRAGGERTLDVHVSRLRKKLGQAARIATVWGIGYRLEDAT